METRIGLAASLMRLVSNSEMPYIRRTSYGVVSTTETPLLFLFMS